MSEIADPPVKALPILYGWFSSKMAEHSGYSVYSSEDGTEQVHVTVVTSNLVNFGEYAGGFASISVHEESGWDDLEYSGVVKEWLRKDIPARAVKEIAKEKKLLGEYIEKLSKEKLLDRLKEEKAQALRAKIPPEVDRAFLNDQRRQFLGVLKRRAAVIRAVQKNIDFGRAYGMGPIPLAKSLEERKNPKVPDLDPGTLKTSDTQKRLQEKIVQYTFQVMTVDTKD